MITLESAPLTYAYSRLPMLFELSTDKYEIQAASGFTMSFTMGTTPTAGQTIIFTWGNNVVTFVFSASTSDSGTLLPITTSTTPIITALGKNYLLSRDFLITAASGTITIAAINEGSDYNIVVTGTYSLGASITNGQDRTLRNNFKVLLDVFLSGNSPVATLQGTPNIDNIVPFGVSDILASLLTSTKPAITETTIQYCLGLMQRYSIRTTEKYDVNTFLEAKVFGQYYALYGMPRLNAATTFTPPNYGLLSIAPLGKDTNVNQPDWLYLALKADYIAYDYTLVVDATYEASVPSSITSSTLTLTAPNDYGVWRIPVSVDALIGLSLFTTGDRTKIKTYRVRIAVDIDGTTYYLDGGTRRVNQCAKPYEKCFMYRNSYGAYETFWCLGVDTKSIKTASDIYTNSFSNDVAAPNQEVVKYNTSAANKYRSSTGYQTKDWIDHLAQEFVPSEDVWLISDDKVIPVVIDTNSLEYAKDISSGLPSFRFDYTLNQSQAAKHNI